MRQIYILVQHLYLYMHQSCQVWPFGGQKTNLAFF